MNDRPTSNLIVSSAHLAQGALPELSEFEYGMTVGFHAFQRWMSRAMAAAGHADMAPLEVQVLHTVYHRDRPKTLADICLVLNVEDTHTVNYALTKLSKAGLVKFGRQGKEKTAAATQAGADLCLRYRDVREKLLLAAIAELGIAPEEVRRVSALLRLMSGQYDQAARAATSL